jgi:glycosyltransferase involved in cell wall biosynthesis
MRIALVHYHLGRGGVSSVLLNQARALALAGVETMIIAGEAAPADFGFPFACVEGLGYNKPEAALLPAAHEAGARRLAEGICAAMDKQWGGAADVVHVHNPLIQKNALLLPALKLLAGSGITLLLQNHDLAEDFRPDVYSGAAYPENCHYAVINSRDFDFLARAGLCRDGLHLIPNEVSALCATPGLERKRYLYPVRAIRRKNIGEALLLSLFVPKGRTVAITLPSSEKDAALYQHWKNVALELGLPLEFEAGLHNSLEDLLGSAVCALTTSVKEGFGFSFLEPWTAGLGLAGRRINYVCDDFVHAGIRFDALYDSLELDRKLGGSDLEGKMAETMRRIYASFGMQMPDRVTQGLPALAGRGMVDFGRLDEEAQEQVIRTFCKNPDEKHRFLAANPLLERLASWQADADLVEANCRAIADHYSRERILDLLLEAYKKVMYRPQVHSISRQVLLDLYLDPERLFLTGIANG